MIRENFNGDRNTFMRPQAQTTLSENSKNEQERMIVQAMRHKNVELNTIISPNKIQILSHACLRVHQQGAG